MDEDADTEDIDLVHCRITSTAALRLERFTQLRVRNQIHYSLPLYKAAQS